MAACTLAGVRAVVITPTVGEPQLTEALHSVRQQGPKVRHLLVVDGQQHLPAVQACLQRSGPHTQVDLLTLPRCTGAAGVFGHRALAAGAFTVDEDVIFPLDADNIFATDHIQTCLAALQASGADWCYALREIMDADGNLLMEDDGESLGFWPRAMFYNAQRGFYSAAERHFALACPFLVDTSCFCVKRSTFLRFAAGWDNGHGADSLFAKALIEQAKGVGTGCTTVRYRLHGANVDVKRRHFEHSNATMRLLYGERLPWRQRTGGYVHRPLSVPHSMPPTIAQTTATLH